VTRGNVTRGNGTCGNVFSGKFAFEKMVCGATIIRGNVPNPEIVLKIHEIRGNMTRGNEIRENEIRET
jgi:hypothetical protein